ncbi:lanthionine synthetase C family protein [Chitinophaga qingshengii]|uniref:Lanthionine synthetase C family protein n=1 Tax=Chitinophaga qingshengii TaxID=1569794 RepID=A0ABR7TGA2_9BACT|nr:lanthionine synthetase C family protein [Chitinophaga qingshengii]MBC9929450.1 lanthionine synthetase C family protein [Chitinophaga qingshengii]
MNHKEEISTVLENISRELDVFTANDNNAGLLGGYTGCALFYAYYYQHTSGDEHLNKVLMIMEKSIQALAEQPMNGSFCGGVAGVGWCVQHLTQMGFIEEDELEDAFGEIDGMVADFMEETLSAGKNDFLHEGLGTALYFLERPLPVAKPVLERLVGYLASSAHRYPAGITWKDVFSSRSEQYKTTDLYNLGLAHGVPAILAILGRIYEKGIARDTARRLIEEGISWLMTTRKSEKEDGESLFPVLKDASGNSVGDVHSRLGWCYGDLGIATMLLGAGKRLQRADYTETALTIFHDVAKHRNEKNGAVYDACLCHGSAGIAHILQQAAMATGDPAIEKAAANWLQITLGMNTWQDGPAGYKFFHHPDYHNSYNVLEGIAGVGLSLLGFLQPDVKPGWNNSLLIS